MKSRASLRYMSSWVSRNFDSKLSQEENWSNAEKAWDALTPEVQGQLIILSHAEVQNGDDIREGLLATLHSYQGSRVIKELFETAIRHVEYK